MSMRTITLKLYKPGRRKRQVIDAAMLDYSRAFQYLLDRAYDEIEEIQEKYKDQTGGYRAAILTKWVDKGISKDLNRFGIEPFKDSLKLDFATTLAGYLSLKKVQDHVSYPVAYICRDDVEDKYESMMQQLLDGKKSEREFERDLQRLLKKHESLRPVFFCRYGLNREYCLLYDEQNDRYFAKIYLMNVKSSLRKEIQANEQRTLVYIGNDAGIVEKSNRRERFIIFPLSFGKWQESFLKEAVANPGILKTARLTKKGGEYYLSISVEIEEAAKVETTSYLGVARSLKHHASFSVVNARGEFVKEGHVKSGDRAGIKNIFINDIHRVANEIVNEAVCCKSRVVMEQLIDKGDKLQWDCGDQKVSVPMMDCYSYNQLEKILEYKLPEKGLPPPVKVSPVGIFYTCPDCGLNSKHNRFSRDMFICTACGKAMDIEKLGSLNIARKILKYGKDILKIKVEKTAEGVRFVNKDLGIEFYPSNPYDCMDEFRQELRRIAGEFRDQIKDQVRDRSFKKRYSLFKKIEEENDLSRIIRII